MRTSLFLTTLLFLATTASTTFADNFYTYAPSTYQWVGTDENRQKPPTAEYASTYGDEASISYSLPWPFTFYGQSFGQINADTNGNIWFGSSGSANSFDLASNGRGPVIAAWNNDLSSYSSGGVFIQHKTSPESVVVEWQTEIYTNEGRRKPNTFEAVLFPDGKIRLDYKSFTQSAANKDFGSGISFNAIDANTNLTTIRDKVFNLAGQSFLFSPVRTVNIVATRTGCGNIAPYGTIPVNTGGAFTFTLSPNTGKNLAGVKVDGVSVNIVNNSYTFTNITDNHTISADFIAPDGDVNLDGVLTQADATLALQIASGAVIPTQLMVAHGDAAPIINGVSTPNGKIDTGDAIVILGKVNGTQTWDTTCISSPVCSSQPVRIPGVPSVYYMTLQGAYDTASSGATIQTTTATLTENLNFQRAATVTLNGGYGCDYASSPNFTTIKGTLTISNGTVIVNNITIQ